MYTLSLKPVENQCSHCVTAVQSSKGDVAAAMPNVSMPPPSQVPLLATEMRAWMCQLRALIEQRARAFDNHASGLLVYDG